MFPNHLKPKTKRFTTAKAPQTMDINIEELMFLSEDENDAEEEWRPDRERRVSKKSKVTGVSWWTPHL